MRLIDYFDRGARIAPERDCFHDTVRGYSYRAVEERSHAIANGILDATLPPGPKIAVYSPNDARAFECILGLSRAGATWVPINARYSLEDNIDILDRMDCHWLFYHSQFEEHVARIQAANTKIERYLCIDRDGDLSPGVDRWQEAYRGRAPDVRQSPHDVAVLGSSGGTTGRSKGVMLTHANLGSFIVNLHASLPSAGPHVQLVAAPITHFAGVLVWAQMARGATNLILPGVDIERILDHVGRHRATFLYLPPTVIYMMLAHPRVREFDYSSLEYFVYAAAPMAPEKIKESMHVFGPVMAQIYAQAETTATGTCLSRDDHVAALAGREGLLAGCGRPAYCVRMEAMDDDGNLLPPGQVGEIVVRGPVVMKGYYREPEETERASRFGWHHTGDVGYRGEDGYFYLVDRKKDMIVSGGFNVYSSEVEQVLLAHPAVQDCAVIGVPDDKWGEAVKAVVELKPQASVTAEQLLAACRQRLGGLKAPKSVDFWPALPRSAVGKILKRDIRQHYWQGQSRMVH
jgi:acyl-CoA synthetase (AMP-forming)/AMP-acid ligase II